MIIILFLVVIIVLLVLRDLLKLMLSQDTTEEDMVVMDMDVDTMERGRLMLSPDTLEEDMAVMVVLAMEDMVIAVKFFPLFIVPPPIDFLLVLRQKT